MLLSSHMRNSEHFDPHPLLVCMANCQFVRTLFNSLYMFRSLHKMEFTNILKSMHKQALMD